MPRLIALTVSVGVLAVLATWIFGLDPLVVAKLQVWQAFIAWGCHFHSGGGFTGSRNTVLCMSFGALVGMVSVMLANQFGALGSLGAPIAVGIGASVIVLASSVSLLAVIPASVYGFASIAGLILLGGLFATPEQALIPTILSIIIGTIFGYVSEIVANALTKQGA